MNWLRRKIIRWLDNDIYRNERLNITNSFPDHGGSYSDNSRPHSSPTMIFRVFNANGGKIVEFEIQENTQKTAISPTYSYPVHALYLIREDEDFGDAIKKIAMMHQLSGR